MKIDLRDEQRQRLGRVEVDPTAHPTRVRTIDTNRDVFLNWDSAVDDSGQLRRCVACGCGDLYRLKSFPQITWFVVVAAFAGAVIGLLGLATPPMLAAMILVLVLDIAILVFSRTRLICYRCRSTYQDLPIASYHRSWDRALAERYPAPSLAPASSDTADAADAAPRPAPAQPAHRTHREQPA